MKISFLLLLCLFSANLYAVSPNLDPANSIPADNAFGVALDADIVLDFDIDVYNNSPSALIELYDDGDVLIESFRAIGPYSFSGDAGGLGRIGDGLSTADKITLTPGANFMVGTGYYILIPVGSDFSDDASQTDLVSPVTSSTIYNFSTAPSAAASSAAAPFPVPVPTMSIWGVSILAAIVGFFGVYHRRKT